MTTSSHPSTGPAPLMTAAAIAPGPERTLTFVLQNRGVYAGHWLLPGGRIQPGESAEQAARREAAEEAGVRLGPLAPTGIYDIRGRTEDEGPYWFRMHVYRSLRACAVPEGFAPDLAEIAGICQAHPTEVLPHPTDMVVLNDAGLADYDPALVQRLLEADGAAMRPTDAVLPR
ncbi:NUDIX domain-containing protein [Streptomonospora arabica]|uniref:NUDIX domain-containing protein n=1 Tax=Streptomonospora arabica TaxID=412417 RepID=A0ABV9SS47_9ACTN